MAKKKAVKAVVDNTHSKLGTIITIVGIPNQDEKQWDQSINRITEAALSAYEQVEIVQIPNVDLTAASVEHFKKLLTETSEETQARHTLATTQAFDIAQKWSSGTDLTPRERVHGAVRDLHHHHHGENQPRDAEGRFVHVNPGEMYAQHYDNHFETEIKARSIRAAKDLFGK